MRITPRYLLFVFVFLGALSTYCVRGFAQSSSCATPSETELFGLEMVTTGAIAKELYLTNCSDHLDTFYAAISGEGYYLAKSPLKGTEPSNMVGFSIMWWPNKCQDYPGNIYITNPRGDTLTIVALKGRTAGFEFETANNPDIVAKKDSVVSYVVTIKNVGTIGARLGTPIASGPFAVGVVDPVSWAHPGDFLSVPITFVPTDTGVSTGTLSFPDIVNNVCTTYTVQLHGHTPGTQQDKSAISVSTTTLFNDIYPLGQAGIKPLTITNVGDIAATVRVSITGEDFSLSQTNDTTIPPGASVVHNVRYSSDHCSHSTGKLTVTNLTDPNSIDVTLDALTYGSQLSVSGLETIQCYAGDSAKLTVTVTNISPYSVVLHQPIIAPPFYIAASEDVLVPGASMQLVITFAPKAAGTYDNELSFANAIPGQCSPEIPTVKGLALGKPDPVEAVRPVSERNGYLLEQNYPNPFNPSTTIPFFLPNDGAVRIDLKNELGMTIRTLLATAMHRGEHSLAFNAADLPSGTYYYTLTIGETTLTRRLDVVK